MDGTLAGGRDKSSSRMCFTSHCFLYMINDNRHAPARITQIHVGLGVEIKKLSPSMLRTSQAEYRLLHVQLPRDSGRGSPRVNCGTVLQMIWI
jgi:hypothetical protein